MRGVRGGEGCGGCREAHDAEIEAGAAGRRASRWKLFLKGGCTKP